MHYIETLNHRVTGHIYKIQNLFVKFDTPVSGFDGKMRVVSCIGCISISSQKDDDIICSNIDKHLFKSVF